MALANTGRGGLVIVASAGSSHLCTGKKNDGADPGFLSTLAALLRSWPLALAVPHMPRRKVQLPLAAPAGHVDNPWSCVYTYRVYRQVLTDREKVVLARAQEMLHLLLRL